MQLPLPQRAPMSYHGGVSVTACNMDPVHTSSGHQATGMAPSVCTTPASPSPVPDPYPVMGSSAEGVVGAPTRTKISGAKPITVGSCLKTCHGNEAGTMKEVVSMNTSGACFLIAGAPTVLIELGMAGITGSACMMNRSPGA